jgi:hypothetical protein
MRPTHSLPLLALTLASAFMMFVACSDENEGSGPTLNDPLRSREPGASEDGGTTGNGVAPTASVDGDGVALGPPAVQFIGRFDTRDPDGPKCAWPGCRIVARFSGTSATARLREIDQAWMEGAPSEWDVAIDGTWLPKFVMNANATNELVIAKALPPGVHVVELYKRSEAQTGVVQFLGFDFGDGTLLPPPARKKRRIEIIGDSAASAFGVEGVGLGPDCPGYDWAAQWENFRKSFGVRLGDALDAEVFGTVYSGKGMSKNIWPADKDTMPIIFLRADPLDPKSTWDFTSFIPDVVVVMMGGNDFAIGQPYDEGPATLADFTEAYAAFVALLRQRYESAQIFLVTSASVSDAQPPGRNTRTNVVTGITDVLSRRVSAGDDKVHGVMPRVAQPSELTGCNGHGGPELHQRLADELAEVVRSRTSW